MIELIRYIDAPFGTYGELYLPEFRCLTVERPWADNRPNESCIPPGTYSLNTTMYQGKYKTFEILPVSGRTLIKIHVANTPSDLLGCIGLGKNWGWLDGQLAVTSSKDTFDAFWHVASAEKPQHIEIKYKEHPESIPMKADPLREV